MPEQCKEMVYVRDTYRRTGRGPSGFTLHYTHRRCERKAGSNGYCWQHPWTERRRAVIEAAKGEA